MEPAGGATSPNIIEWAVANEDTVITYICYLMLSQAVAAFVALVWFTNAPYGRYSSSASPKYGCPVPGRAAWMLQEAPSFCLPLVCIAVAGGFAWVSDAANLPNVVLLSLYLFHYTNRTWVFPLRLRGGKPTPFVVCLLAFVFCLFNGYLQARYLTKFATYPPEWITSPTCLAGIALFFSGLAINWVSDNTLMNLRKPGETGYKIPRGFMFEYVSGANFFGECLEWAGFAVACWSLPALSFAVFTFCNIGPRARQHHDWYLQKFEEYKTLNRKALVPFVW